MKISDYIIKRLFEMQDTAYRDFHSRLVPTLDKETIIGVRTPALRAFAKELAKNEDIDSFLKSLPHKYYEENNLHAFVIETYKSFDACIDALDTFLPFVNNWATCDGMRPKCFKGNEEKLLSKALEWINDDRVYVKRFGIEVIMNHFLDEHFDKNLLDIVSEIRSDEYYINMMIAWFFATALAKQYDKTIAYIQNGCLDRWTHNKTIQKAVESFRLTDSQKEYLKTLKK